MVTNFKILRSMFCLLLTAFVLSVILVPAVQAEDEAAAPAAEEAAPAAEEPAAAPASKAEASDEEIAADMATLFRAARSVISKHQGEINDPELGDKGLTADVVVNEAKANYKAATGHDLEIDTSTRKGQFLQAELDAIGAVMNEAQALINEKGKGLKGFLPAVFAGQVANRTSDALSGKAKVKLTAPKEFVRNRKNRPDKWEHNVIETMFKAEGYEKNKTFSEETTEGDKTAFRFILPEYYKEGCLACHGDPKGELDITGGKKEGGKLGDLGGAISVTIYK